LLALEPIISTVRGAEQARARAGQPAADGVYMVF